MKKVLVLTLIVCLSILSACGWRLRGSESFNIEQNIYLASASGDVYTNIKRVLTRNKPEVSIADADIQLVLGEEIFDRRSASVNDQLQTTQYQLNLLVTYDILDSSGKPLVSEATIDLSRYYTFNQNAIVSSDKEEQALRKEMVRQVSRQILQRVRFLLRK